jgi:hypothetical protein
MSKQCPQCRTIVDFKAHSCNGCRLSFFNTPSKPKDFTYICVRIAGAAFVVTGLIVAILSSH